MDSASRHNPLPTHVIDIPLSPPRLHDEPGPASGHSGVCQDGTSTNDHSDSVAAQLLVIPHLRERDQGSQLPAWQEQHKRSADQSALAVDTLAERRGARSSPRRGCGGVQRDAMVLPEELIPEIVAAKGHGDYMTSVLEQLTLAEFIASGAYDRHVSS